MAKAPLPNMTSGIISVWFRDTRKNDPPAPREWPSGVWSAGTDSMVPPDTFEVIKQPAFKQNIFYWNAYGQYVTGGGVTLPIFESPSVMMPSPPPFVTNEMHMMLTFGNPAQSYDYRPWIVEFPEVIEAVEYIPQLVNGPQWSVTGSPPPYAPWIESLGKFTVSTFVLGAPEPKPNYVPQSFIGVDKDGYLTICLQTNTKAEYKGYAFQLDKVTEIRADASYFEAGPDFITTGGSWIKAPGYWDGYQFYYTDVSNEVMGAQPETFVIGGPPAAFDFVTIPAVSDGAWHHLLFSFDISGGVELTLPSTPPGGSRPPPIVKTACKAWLALDDVNYKGGALQHRFAMPDGFQSPLLPGMGTDVTGFGPVTSSVRSVLNLGNNDIMPRNSWIISFRNSPKNGLRRFASSAGTWNEESTVFINKGDYNFFRWTANVWTLFAAGNWQAVMYPSKPDNPDPKIAFSVPTYQCDGFSIPTAGHPIGIPVSAHHLEHNTGLEMAELQIWANRTIDTNNVNLRRLFVDANGEPVPPSKAAQVLGRPDVLLHGNGNWQKGKNTGKAGTDDEDNLIPNGQFVPVAGIEKFKPEPDLGK